MKKTKIFYWIITGIFAAFMAFTAIPDILMSAEAVQFIKHLGYPEYFIPFIGYAKILGAIAILVPGFPRIKEWAYAGLAYDLIGATYSQIATDGFQPAMLFMVVPFTFLILSYLLYTKIQKYEKTLPKTIDEYISGFPANVQEILKQVRETVKETAPQAEEAIKYGMPTFTLNGNLVYFAAFKNHIGFYPLPKNKELAGEFSHYQTGKGSIQFPFDRPVPLELIAKIVAIRIKENGV